MKGRHQVKVTTFIPEDDEGCDTFIILREETVIVENRTSISVITFSDVLLCSNDHLLVPLFYWWYDGTDYLGLTKFSLKFNLSRNN